MSDVTHSITFTNEKVWYAWREVKAELPPENEIILAYNGEESAVCKFIKSFDGYFFMLNGTSHQILKVIHWMWLPPIPPIQKKELVNYYHPDTCTECGGAGRMPVPKTDLTCPCCSGRIKERACKVCNGRGYQMQQEDDGDIE